jgi:PIN domain nuclease of toxin-antitoxin system
MLVAQAIHEGLTLVSSDQAIAKYAVPMVWE